MIDFAMLLLSIFLLGFVAGVIVTTWAYKYQRSAGCIK